MTALPRPPYSSSNDGSRREVEAGIVSGQRIETDALRKWMDASGRVKGERVEGREGVGASQRRESLMSQGRWLGLGAARQRKCCVDASGNLMPRRHVISGKSDPVGNQ